MVMNIQNIASLTQKLTTLGFDESIGYRLLQHICFKPADFILTERIVKGKDALTFSIFFERKSDEYNFSYYDAAFLKEMEMPDLVINSINIRELDERMVEIAWVTDNKAIGAFSLESELTWEREKRIEKIVTDLSRLSVTDEGKNSIEEAHRFLLNRWLEKKLLAKKKKDGIEMPDDTVGSDKSLLQKKRRTKVNKLKK